MNLLKEIATGGPPKSAFVSSLISELADLNTQPTLLVLDDFHLVDDRQGPSEFVARLTHDAPPWLRIIVSTRRRPNLELSRLAAAGELAEIRTPDLRFSHDEISQFFATSSSTPLDDDVLATLDDRTMGWIASLQLFDGSIRGKPPAAVRSLARALSGATSPIYDFLAEEVLANLKPDLELMLIRASILKNVSAREVAALQNDLKSPPSQDDARTWIDDADRMGLLSRTSNSSDERQLHPLLRDFLQRQLTLREDEATIREMHLRVAESLTDVDPLTAAHHLVEAGRHTEAMGALGASIMLTVGSGRWGDAAELIATITGVPADPAVAAIRARQLMERGELAAATQVLGAVDDISTSPADIRAVFRHMEVSLGWRTGNVELMYQALKEIDGDPETPSVFRDIADVLLDASPISASPASLSELGQRLHRMAGKMAAERLTYYSAIGLHDSAIAFLNAGDFVRALQTGSEALERFSSLTFFAPEQLSTHTTLAICEQELGNSVGASAHAAAALSSGLEFADVPAELAFMSVLLGDNARGLELITRARVQQRQSHSDPVGDALLECACALGELRTSPDAALIRLDAIAFDSPLELGYALGRQALIAQAMLVGGDESGALRVSEAALTEAKARDARRPEVRLAILNALAKGDRTQLMSALAEGERTGHLAILEVVDAVLARMESVAPISDALDRSIRSYPNRWLPAIRRRLEGGNTANARAAAAMLDEYGSLEDVGLLRAYAKTYARRGPGRDLGRALARRTSPKLLVHDLGRVTLIIGDRTVQLTGMRRKPAAVLMYLVTRTGLVANRDQIVDDLWPDADPSGGTNNLNQSLYFLRREIDPWYEEDISVDYVRFRGDLVWLDPDLVVADSFDFLKRSRECRDDVVAATSLLAAYAGQFAPEFEYEDWAIGWRSRLQSTFLELANTTIERLAARGDVLLATKIAADALQVDQDAREIELRLVWLYGQQGLQSAARAQYDHLARRDEADGLETTPLSALLEGRLPDS